MRILILGAAGFIGRRLTRTLLSQEYLIINGRKKQEISKLVLFDKEAVIWPSEDNRIEALTGDICDVKVIESLFHSPFDVIFHLAAIVSGEAEHNFDLGMQVNLFATLQLLETCRRTNINPTFIFASSCAVFGGELESILHDDTAATPQSSYGSQKAIAELLINDYSRKGYLDGRILRLPTIVVRPGKPNAAASSFASSIIREPLQGRKTICPVAPETNLWICSPKMAIEHFIHASGIHASALGTNRIINLPGLSTSVEEMANNLEDLANRATVELIEWQPDPFIQKIVATWPVNFVTTKADSLGFRRDASIRQVVQTFIDEDLTHSGKRD